MKILKHILVAVFAASGLMGCLRDNIDTCPPQGNGNIILELQMPESYKKTVTRIGMAADKEFEISSLDVLVFQDKGAGGEKFLYMTETPEVVSNPVGSATKSFKVVVRKSDGQQKQRLVLVANLHTEVMTAMTSVEEGDDKEAVLSKIKFNTGYGWDPDRALPMWGESDVSLVVSDATQGGHFGAIEMLYSVARIDVGVNLNDDKTAFLGHHDFKISSVYLFNANSNGFAAPKAANWGADKKPTIPGDAWIMSHNFSSYHDQGGATVSPDNGFMRYIYASEILNKGKDYDDVGYIVVGGDYYDKDDNKTESTWYRIDFYDRSKDDPNAHRLDILRGHRYMINITGADGPGAPSYGGAKDQVVNVINATVTVWNEQGIVTEFGGDSKVLTVTPKSEWSFGAVERDEDSDDNKTTIYTNCDGGWRVSAVTDNNGNAVTWLGLSETSGDRGSAKTVSILVDEYNSLTPRYGRIHIEAGQWTYTINVEQKLNPIEVSPSVIEVNFDYYQSLMPDNRVIIESESKWMVESISYIAHPDEDNDHEDGSRPELADWLHVINPYLDYPEDIMHSNLEVGVDWAEEEEAYLRIYANPQSHTRSAVVTFVNEDNQRASVTVKQGWVNCGIAGVPKYRTVNFDSGAKQVPTHLYGMNARRVGLGFIKAQYFETFGESMNEAAEAYIYSLSNDFLYSCYMIEDLKEGTPAVTNDAGIIDPETLGPVSPSMGYFYRKEVAETICPAGWRLPSESDGNNMFISATAMYEYDFYYYAPDYAAWMDHDTYMGGITYTPGGDISGFGNTSYAMWHTTQTEGSGIYESWYYLETAAYYQPRYVGLYGYSGTRFMAQVRCVEDIPVNSYPQYSTDN